MSDKLKVLKGEPQHEKTNDHEIGNSPSVRQSECTVLDNPARRPWPFAPSDASPLAWWRTLPSDAFGDTERLHLLTTLKQIDVLHGGDDFAPALEGDLSAAIGVAFALMPIGELNLKIDIAMTALLRCALERNAAAALVLAQVLGLTDLGHSFATELVASWLAYGRRCSDNPRKFIEVETVLLAAFRERHHYGDDA
ncbi:hypothetical protein [Bradyrhizobium sp. JYMT SZCCT0180]|uniref:hypothetical protein n=1 Tax=Bradyrhizobium sp. JYMT SZCCT0180 TaxID=2807666 RepID=UPI001BA9F7FE|nr:hypothetical protein [Bradyrhizobium sp. JYMT SZCCT0180]MBR1215562.1 hypothetical protein [Bradyrhizobium sp. JYMT SZCCT0180]